MDEQNSPSNKNYGSLEYWKTRPPEELLEAYINELRGPLASIKGYIELMRMSNSMEIRARALEVIPQLIEKLEKEEEFIKEYLVELKKKS